jgi:hypothetical protein
MSVTIKELLHKAAYFPAEMDRILDKKNKAFIKFDPELGYLLNNYVFRDGENETLSVYTYHKHGGHRLMLNYATNPCRINTYGDSYTQCAQVSDGETWQEILAAHIREPIRNFGVGGYGVYHAYLRALRTEAIPDLSAEYVILNIWDDDHLRNIDAARWIRVAWVHKNLPRGGGPETYPVHGFPWGHVRWDINQKKFVEMPGCCRSEKDLAKLADKENYYNAFKDDHVVHLYVLANGGDAPVEYLEEVAKAFGLKLDLRNPATRQEDACKLHLVYGLRSTMFIVDKMQAWAKALNKKLVIMLSYDVPTVRTFIEKGTRFDQGFVEYLKEKKFLYVDALQKAANEYKFYNLGVNDFLDRFYIGRAGAQVFGHYNPYGNFWFAQSIKKEIVNWLDPKPPTYH